MNWETILIGFVVGALIAYALGWHLKGQCPKCKSRVPEDASKCKHCGSDLGE
jgi:rRNA maturation endonuclease Nob1